MKRIAAVLAAVLALAAAPAAAQIEILLSKPILGAVERGETDAVRQALLKGESPNQIDARRQPLLILAVSKGHVEVAEVLLKGGAIVDATDGEGRTALLRAA
ncbi:MAG: ankyrin repeat domain-containing protein, partial [Rhodospirillales bacterium]|nr:ankyrin repeat domain-containing protein [Rhodospirillales bacterium]